jgi:hypothetical protein
LCLLSLALACSAGGGDEEGEAESAGASEESAADSAFESSSTEGAGTESEGEGESSGDGDTDGGGDGDGEGDRVPGLVSVGYGGMRVVSRDAGATWEDYTAWGPDGDDDFDLLRAVTYGNGLWVASGWRWATSTDGVQWTDHGMLFEDGEALLGINCNIIEGLAFADGYFYAACPQWEQPGAIYRSADGMNFEYLAEIGDTGGHLYLDYRDGLLVAYGDTQTSYASSDGVTWEVMPGLVEATYCEGEWRSFSDCHEAHWFDGYYFRGVWSNRIERSSDGQNWSVVWEDGEGDNVPYRARAMARGEVAAP